MSSRCNSISPQIAQTMIEDTGIDQVGKEEDVVERQVSPVEAEGAGESEEIQGEAGKSANRDGSEDEGAKMQDGDIGDEDQEEAERPRALRDPGRPSQAEIDEHDLTHIPYRPWCNACVRAKAKNKMSLKIRGVYSENLVPRVRLDYCHLTEHAERVEGEHGEEETTKAESSVTALVMQESTCRSVWAYAFEHKGAADDWIVEQICEDLDTIGLRSDRIVIKSDQEAAIVDMAKAVARNRASDFGTALESSAVGESDSNGTIERAIQDVEGQIRVLRAALEERINVQIKLSDAIVPWMIRHAACLITRYRVRPSGRTSYQLMKGRRASGKILEFRESIQFKIPKTKIMPGKFEDRWDEGIYLGFDMRSGENLVGTGVGVFRAPTIMRKTLDQRWSEGVLSMEGCPKQPVPNQAYKRAPTYSRRFGATAEEAQYVPQPAPVIPVIRNFKIYREDVITHGATEGCPGCNAVIRGHALKAAHTPECRVRFQDILSQDEYGEARIARANARAAAAAAQPREASKQGGDMQPQEDAEAGGVQIEDGREAESTNPSTRDASRPASSSAEPPLPPPSTPPADRSGVAERLRTAAQAAPRPPQAQRFTPHSPRGGRAQKRRAEDEPDDPRASGDVQEAEVIGPSPRGEKRQAENPPDDPRMADETTQSERVVDPPTSSLSRSGTANGSVGGGGTGLNRERDSPNLERSSDGKAAIAREATTGPAVNPYRLKCATCDTSFATRSQLHRHIRRWKHEKLDDPAAQEELYLKTDKTEKSQEREQIRRAMADHFGARHSPNGNDIGRLGISSVSSRHPGPQMKTCQIKSRDLEWVDV